jgi:protein-tyrosine-phosphatase
MAVKNRSKKKSILFVCCGNRERSLIAEKSLFQSLEDHSPELLNKVKIGSAGIFPKSYIEHAKEMGVKLVTPYFGKSPNIYAAKYLTEKGIDVSSYLSRGLNKRMIISADLILSMDRVLKDEILSLYPEASDRLVILKEFVFGSGCPDPNIGNPMALPEIDKKTGVWVWPEGYAANYIEDIEQCLAKGMEKFLKYINSAVPFLSNFRRRSDCKK